MEKQRKSGIMLIDRAHPFYRPLRTRIAIVAICALWFGFELFISKSPMWMVIAGALLIYTAMTLLITWKDEEPKP